MISIDVLASFSLAACLLALAPGPDNLFVLTQSAMNGARAGIFLVLGLCSGLLLHSAAVAFGLSAILQTSVYAFTTIKIIGACYLIYLAWKAWNAPVVGLERAKARSHGTLYLRGAIMNITNPKVAIFFLAFFPQFIDTSQGAVLAQISVLGLVFTTITFAVFLLIALLAGRLSQRLRANPRIQTVMNRLAAVVFLGLALKLAGSTR